MGYPPIDGPIPIVHCSGPTKEMLDLPLTEIGRQQALRLREDALRTAPQLVLVSPMSGWELEIVGGRGDSHGNIPQNIQSKLN